MIECQVWAERTGSGVFPYRSAEPGNGSRFDRGFEVLPSGAVEAHHGSAILIRRPAFVAKPVAPQGELRIAVQMQQSGQKPRPIKPAGVLGPVKAKPFGWLRQP